VPKAVKNKQGKNKPARSAGKPADKGARSSDGKAAKPSKSTRSRAAARAQARPSQQRQKRSLKKFMHEVRVELGKVSWPDRGDLMQSTLVVLVAVAIAAVYVAGLDAAFSEIVDQIINLIT
jgi:preprotein translocase subunit SecE